MAKAFIKDVEVSGPGLQTSNVSITQQSVDGGRQVWEAAVFPSRAPHADIRQGCVFTTALPSVMGQPSHVLLASVRGGQGSLPQPD